MKVKWDPDKETKRLRYYSEFFDTAEMDASFYERFYKGDRRAMGIATTL
jgi:uncharacterized protein YecE (DUF72 family)